MPINPGTSRLAPSARLSTGFSLAATMARHWPQPAASISPSSCWTHFDVAAAAGHLGLFAEARTAVETMFRLAPALAEPNARREFVTRRYWSEEMIESLLDGVQRSFNGGSTEVLGSSNDRRTSAERSSNDRLKPPSSTSGSQRSGALTVAVRPLLRGARMTSRKRSPTD